MTEEQYKSIKETFELLQKSYKKQQGELQYLADRVITQTKNDSDVEVVLAGQKVWDSFYKEINLMTKQFTERRDKWFELNNQYVAEKEGLT